MQQSFDSLEKKIAMDNMQMSVTMNGGSSVKNEDKSEKRENSEAKVKNDKCQTWFTIMTRKAGDDVGIPGLKYVLLPTENKLRR